MFYYEHIGHMQFSTLTLHALRELVRATGGSVDVWIPWAGLSTAIQSAGFTHKQVEGELERFCYGFECNEDFRNGVRYLAMTVIGRMFIDQLLKEATCQSSQIACLLRPSRRKQFWNVIIQESTFFPPKIYSLIESFGLRRGPARDYLKSMRGSDFTAFVSAAMDALSPQQREQPSFTLDDCITAVNASGKYWATVGGKYSWFVFAQRFELPFSPDDWRCYEVLRHRLIRPPEWGGGVALSYESILEVLGSEERFCLFRKSGIIRPRWYPADAYKVDFCLTAPGYLMWERKFKGPIIEFEIRCLQEKQFAIFLCDADDLSGCCSLNNIPRLERITADKFPSYCSLGSKDQILSSIEWLTNTHYLL